MKDLNKRIGIKLREAREYKNMSLREVEAAFGKNYSTIQSYESGRISITVETMNELCNLYGVNYLDLLQEVYYEDRLKNK